MPTFKWSCVGMSHSVAEKISLPVYLPAACACAMAGISYCAIPADAAIEPPGSVAPVASRGDGRRWFDTAIQSRLLRLNAWSSTVASGVTASTDSAVCTCRSPVVHTPCGLAGGVGVVGLVGVGLAGAVSGPAVWVSSLPPHAYRPRDRHTGTAIASSVFLVESIVVSSRGDEVGQMLPATHAVWVARVQLKRLRGRILVIDDDAQVNSAQAVGAFLRKR